MEAMVLKSELQKCGRVLKAAKLTQAAKKASVNLTVTESLAVIGPGFNQVLHCKPIKWGTVLMPYSTWEYLMGTIRTIPEDEVTLKAEDGRIKIGSMEITGRGIKVTGKDKLPLEMPLNARP